MGLRDRVLAGLAKQLGRPEGPLGRVVAGRLNRFNQQTVAAAVAATDVGPGQSAADIGFGGGVGIPLLLDRVGASGHVDGVDLSDTMVGSAKRRFREQVDDGLLTLQTGSLAALPLDDASLDAAITVNTIYFLGDLGPAFAELARVLRPGGYVVVGMGDPTAMARLPFTRHGFTLRPVEDVQAALVGAGLDAVKRLRVGDGDDAYHLLVAGRAGR